MASMNRSLNPHLDTVFMMTSKDYFFVSSRTIKEVASLGGAVEGLVPDSSPNGCDRNSGSPLQKESAGLGRLNNDRVPGFKVQGSSKRNPGLKEPRRERFKAANTDFTGTQES